MGAPVPAAGQRQVAKKVPVPTNYRNAVKYVRLAVEQRLNVDAQIEQDKHFRCGRTLVGRVLSNLPKIDALYGQLELATKEPRLDVCMARVLIAELMFGSGRLVGNSRPVECVRQYAEQLQSALATVEANAPAAGQIKEPRFVRLNTSVLNLEGSRRLLQEEQWILVEEQFADYRAFLERVKTLGEAEYLEDFHFADLLVFPHSAKSFWARATHLHGQFVLQNKACLLPTYLLKPTKKSVVLDMCAAPGLKTTHLACLMKNKGRIYAVERCAHRYTTLCQYASEHGVIKTMHRDCLDLTDEQVPGVEFILLDPSCSGSGMLKRQQVPEPMDEPRVYKLAGLQYKLLSHAMNAFPHARRIVYSTCSLYQQENEGVVHGVLRHNGHFRLLDARKEFGKEWLNVGDGDAYPGIGERCLYARTEDDLTIGMFVAVFERCPEGYENEVYRAHEKQKESYERVALRYGITGKEGQQQEQQQQVEDAGAGQEATGKGSKKKAGGKRAAAEPEQQVESASGEADVVQKKRKKKSKQVQEA
uniref:SAM-dependent MTase RsmB/NOP-type domain-containing protein n=1 Tax=Anopheles dirus TaxID=7168 RepID=A0A182NYZ2_9DIPT